MSILKNAYKSARNTVLLVPEIEQKVKAATSNDKWGPTGTQMREIAQETYSRYNLPSIMAVIWKRLNDPGKYWRHVYKSLLLVDYLLRNGSEEVVEELRQHVIQIQTLAEFQHIDEDGKDVGQSVRERSRQVMELLKNPELLKKEREKAKANAKRFVEGMGSDEPSFDSRHRATWGGNEFRDRAEFRDRSSFREDDDRKKSLDEEEEEVKQPSPRAEKKAEAPKPKPAPVVEQNLFDFDAPAPSTKSGGFGLESLSISSAPSTGGFGGNEFRPQFPATSGGFGGNEFRPAPATGSFNASFNPAPSSGFGAAPTFGFDSSPSSGSKAATFANFDSFDPRGSGASSQPAPSFFDPPSDDWGSSFQKGEADSQASEPAKEPDVWDKAKHLYDFDISKKPDSSPASKTPMGVIGTKSTGMGAPKTAVMGAPMNPTTPAPFGAPAFGATTPAFGTAPGPAFGTGGPAFGSLGGAPAFGGAPVYGGPTLGGVPLATAPARAPVVPVGTLGGQPLYSAPATGYPTDPFGRPLYNK